MDRCRSQAGVTRQQRSTKAFCKRDVSAVIGREIIPELPDARNKPGMLMTGNAQVQQVLDRFVRSTRRNDLADNQAPEHVKHFDIEEMGSVKRVRMQADSLVNALPCCRPQQPLHDSRGV